MESLSLFGFGRSRDKPENRTSGSGYTFFMGGSTSGKRVNERTAMQMTAVYSCVRILSEAVASLPLQFYRYTDDGGKEKAVEHPLYFLLHDEPNPEMTSFVFRETLMTHLLLWGNAYAQIIRNGRGEVVALYPLMADRMYVDRDDKGQLYYEYTLYSDDAPTMKGSSVRLSPYEVLHIPGLGFDGWWAIRLSLWRRTLSAWPWPARNTGRSFSPTARHLPGCWSIRGPSRIPAGCGKAGKGPSEEAGTPTRWQCWRKG